MITLKLILVYAVLMSIWWIVMKLLMKLGSPEAPFPNNLIRSASGFGGIGLIMGSLYYHHGASYIASLPREFWLWLIPDVMLGVAIGYCYVKAMEKSVASIAVHVTLLAPIVAIGTSKLFGVESLPSFLSGLGIFSVLGGLYVLHFNPRKYEANVLGPIIEIWNRRGTWLVYALTAGICGGFAIPIDKRLVLLSDPAFGPGLAIFLSWGIAFFCFALRARDFSKIRKLRKQNAVVAIIGLLFLALTFGGAQIFQAEAYTHQHAAAVASLKRLDAPITVFWAFLLFPEEETAKGSFFFRVLGSTIAFAGALLIGFDKID